MGFCFSVETGGFAPERSAWWKSKAQDLDEFLDLLGIGDGGGSSSACKPKLELGTGTTLREIQSDPRDQVEVDPFSRRTIGADLKELHGHLCVLDQEDCVFIGPKPASG
jgi:hypothetical protein